MEFPEVTTKDLWHGILFGVGAGLAIVAIGVLLMSVAVPEVGFVLVGVGAFVLSSTLMMSGVGLLYVTVVQSTY